jgi:hypothetical protein
MRKAGERTRQSHSLCVVTVDHFSDWPNAELVQRLLSRQLLGFKRTRCADREQFRV